MYDPKYNRIIEKICINNKIKFTAFDSNCFRLSFGEKAYFIWSRRFPHNTASSARIIDSKCICAKILNQSDVPALEHIMLHRPDTEEYERQGRTNLQLCKELIKKTGGIVIKPNHSYEGIDVFACFSSVEIEKALLLAFRNNKTLSASSYIAIQNEYRVIYLMGKCLLAYKKIRPYVIGDGYSTVRELADRQRLSCDECIGFVTTSIPHKDVRVEIGWKHNLSKGSIPEVLEDSSLRNTIYALSSKAAQAVNAQFVSVDIIEHNKSLLIIEINAGVAMDQFITKHPQGEEIAYAIYEESIQRLFNIR